MHSSMQGYTNSFVAYRKVCPGYGLRCVLVALYDLEYIGNYTKKTQQSFVSKNRIYEIEFITRFLLLVLVLNQALVLLHAW